MRIAEFTMERYGRFEDHRLVLPKRDQDFHLIYGPNEAGKTTTLCALADLLFGFEHRVTHAYRFPAPTLRVGAVLESAGAPFTCRRRRGRTGTIVDAHEAPLDEGRLIAMLHGLGRDAFLQSSSLDHARLRDGGLAMAESRDDLGQMLFAAGSGITNLKQVLSHLDEELDGLWGPRRSDKRAFTRAESHWKEARSKLKETSVKPADWSRTKTELDQATKTYLQTDEARQQAALELAASERLRRVYPLLVRRRGLAEELDQHKGPAVPEATEAAARQALEAAAHQQQRRDATEQLLAAILERLQSEPDQAPVVALGNQIDVLVQDLSAEQERRLARPTLQTVLTGAQTSTQASAENLDLGADAALTAALPSPEVIQQLRELAKRRVELVTRVSAAEEAAAAADEQRGTADEALSNAQPPSAMDELEAAALAAHRAGDLDGQIQKQAALVARERENLMQSLRALQPWSGEMSALTTLVSLPDEAVDEAASTFEALVRQKAEVHRAVSDRAEALDLARARANALAGAEGVVPLETLHDARSERDQSVERITDHLGDGPALPSPHEEVRRLKRAVTAADELADRRFAAADAAAQLAGAEAELIQAEIRHRHGQDQLDQVSAAVEQAEGAWTARLKAQALPELKPEELRAWLRRRSLCLSAKLTLEDSEADLDRLEALRERLRQDLKVVLGQEAGDALAALEPVLAEANVRLEAVRRSAAAFDALKAASKGARARQEDTLRGVKSAQRQLADWQAQWDVVTAEVGLKLQPGTADIRLSAWEGLARARDQVGEAARRLERSDAQSQAFANRAREVADALGLQADADALDCARQAKGLLETARATEGKRQALQEEADKHAHDRAVADAALAAAETGLADALKLTGATDRLTLAAALDQARESRRLEGELRTLDQELADQADGVALAELEADCAELNFDQLSARAEVAKAKAEEDAQHALNARSVMAEAAVRFNQFEAQADAAGWASELELARAELESLADDYILKKTQRLLLGHAMKRQAEQARHPLLTRAAELFEILTLQRYANLIIDRDTEKPRLLGVCDGGQSTVQIDDMSEGTQDQLFLALRLAAVEQSMANGACLPFLADDLFVTFDDDRAKSGLQVLGELSRTTQVLFFTHHAHLRELAETLFPSLSVHDLQEAG